MYVNNYTLSNYNISVLLEQYYADVFVGNKEENAQLFTGLSISNVWNDYDGLLRLTESDYTFKNSDGIESQSKFLIGGNIGSKYDFGDFIGFKINTSDIDIFFLLPEEQVDLDDVFTKENIINLQKHNYVNSISNYTRCLFPEFEIKTIIDVNDFIKNEYNILEEGLEIIQNNSLRVNRYGINSTEITLSHEDLEYTGTKYEYLDDFILDRPFGFLVSFNDILLYSGVVNNI